MGTVIYDDNITVKKKTLPPMNEEKHLKNSNSVVFNKMVRDQTIDLINQKLEDYYHLPSSKRTFVEFKPLLKCICLNYFVEIS